MDTNKAKLLFYTLLECAMRYREGYWREEHEKYAEEMHKGASEEMSKHDRAKRRRIERSVVESLERRLRGIEHVNGIIYNELDKLKASYSADADRVFDNFTTAFALAAEELEKADNTTHMLAVMRLYNEGYFKDISEHIINESKKFNTKYENDEKISDHSDILSRPEHRVPEEQPTTGQQGDADSPGPGQ